MQQSTLRYRDLHLSRDAYLSRDSYLWDFGFEEMPPLSNTQFHARLDSLITETCQKHRDEIQTIFKTYISYISKKDAEIYLPRIKLKLQETRLDHDIIIENINVLCNRLAQGLTIDHLPKEIQSSFFISKEIREKQALSLVNQSFQEIAQNPVYLASFLESEESAKMSLEEKLKMAKKAGTKLRILRLQATNIKDQQLQDVLKACSGLKTLEISEYKSLLIDATIKFLPPNLQVLILLNCNQLTDAAIKNLPSNLQRLELTWCDLTDASIKDLPRNLQTLNLSICYRLTDAAIKDLPCNLQTLDLSSCYLTNKAIKDLPRNLQTLNLSRCFHSINEAIKDLPPNLQTLNLSKCTLTNEAIKDLPRNLQTLNLSRDASFGEQLDAGIKDLPPNLQMLNLSGCKLTNEAIKDLPRTLQTLDLSFCDQLTDAAIKDLPPNLQMLNLSRCYRLTNAAIKDLPPNLHSLDLSYCRNLTYAAIQYLPPNLTLNY